MDSNSIFSYDIVDKKVISSCTLNPADVSKASTCWLWARNNKYDLNELDPRKIGKWIIFLPRAKVNETWNKIKEAVQEGHLWDTKVSTSDHVNDNHVIIIYTKDYSDTDDVIKVLDFLEESGIKPANTVIQYKTDEQTYSGVYSSGNQKASIYDSNTVRIKFGKVKDSKQRLMTDFFK